MAKKTIPKNLINSKEFRFVIVGGVNTVIDFAFYNFLSKIFSLALPVANMISSFIAMLFSFFMNKKWTFRSSGKNYLREIVLFFIFTIISIWVIQSGLIWLVENTFSTIDWQNFWTKNLLKIAASIPSLIWNYVTYNRFVFKDK
ncbi:GtrA family protein [Candidatus Saccharibacteria bacterium]|nr:GtrA family protein [Candidatus Saccharibacteria bacterium]